MNGNNLLVDTNFLIYLLNGRQFVTAYLENNYFISEITEMELLGVKELEPKAMKIRSELIRNCTLIIFNPEIKKIAIQIKQHHTVKLPDAIVSASALHTHLPLVTADKSFTKISELDLRLLKVA